MRSGFRPSVLGAVMLVLLPGAALAQSTAAQVVTGYLTSSGCPSAALTPCFVQFGASGGASVSTSPGARTLVPLDVATVTTGGTAVTALSAGHRTAGGFLTNPKAAAVDLCINEIGTATGTTSAGNTTCIPAGSTYTLVPAAGAVSVISSDSSHPFSGEGLN